MIAGWNKWQEYFVQFCQQDLRQQDLECSCGHSIKICNACSVKRCFLSSPQPSRPSPSVTTTEQLPTFCLWKNTTRKGLQSINRAGLSFDVVQQLEPMPGDRDRSSDLQAAPSESSLGTAAENTFGQPWSLTACTRLRSLNMLQFVPCKSLFNKASSSWESVMNAAYFFRSLHLTPIWGWGIKKTKSKTDCKTGCFKAHSHILWVSNKVSEEKHFKICLKQLITSFSILKEGLLNRHTVCDGKNLTSAEKQV